MSFWSFLVYVLGLSVRIERRLGLGMCAYLDELCIFEWEKEKDGQKHKYE